MKYTIFFIPVFLLYPVTSYPTIINVPGNYPSIQQAINAASNFDTVLVEPGTYFENVNFRGKKIVLTSRYYVNSDPSYITSTVINGSTPSNPDTASCVIISSGEDSSTVLQGFTITAGAGTKWFDIHGAGTYREGGGILIELSSPVIRHNIIRNNEAINLVGVAGAGGGGIRIGDGNPRILNNIIINNMGRYGAGIVLNYTGCIIRNNIIAQNSGGNSFSSGSAIWSVANFGIVQKIIQNNTIIYNSASTGTGGVLSQSTTLILKNNIIWGNTSPSGAQIQGTVVASYCDVQGGWVGPGNINLPPSFADTNYYLSLLSPCIDAGDTSAVYNDPEDSLNPGFARFPSRGTIRNDMGAYGGPGSSILSNSLIGIEIISGRVPDYYKLYQNYPNPFNPVTEIKFDLPEPAYISFSVYDILGRQIGQLIDRKLNSGVYAVSWDASDYPSGIYFGVLRTESYTESVRMVLLK